jgi:PEGA domain
MKRSLVTLVFCFLSAWGGGARADWWCATSVSNANDRGCWESKRECEAQMPETRGYTDCRSQAQAAVVSVTFRVRGAVNAAFPEPSFCQEARAAWLKDPDVVRVSPCSIERSVSRPSPTSPAPGRAATAERARDSFLLPSTESCEAVQEAAREICDTLYKAAAAGLIVLERASPDDARKRAVRLCNVARSQADVTCAASSAPAANRDSGSVVVESARGGSIILDGRQQGSAPAVLWGLSAGVHTIEVRSGDETWRQAVTVAPGQQVKVTATFGRR